MTGPYRYYVDTNVIIAIVETWARLSAGQQAFLADLQAGLIEALTSELTLAECLVKPLAEVDVAAIAAYQQFLDNRANFPVLPVTRDVLIKAAAIRAQTRSPLPDAIHIATAVNAQCDRLLTDDKRLRPVAPLQIQFWTSI